MSRCITWLLREHPALRATIKSHDRIYNEAAALIRKPPEGVSIVEICPPDGFQPGRFTRDVRLLMDGYEQGRAMADEAITKRERIS